MHWMDLYDQKEQPEIVWMLNIRIVFAYVLNDQLGYDFEKEDRHVLVGSKFLAWLKRPTGIFWIFP